MDQQIRPRAAVLVAALAVGFCLAQAAPVTAADHGAAVDALLARYASVKRFSGTTLVAEAGKVIQEGAYGMADAAFGVRNGPTTRFRLAAAGEVLVDVLALQLVDERRMGLDDTVVALLPDYRQDTGARITLRNVLAHTTGLPEVAVDAAPCAGGGTTPAEAAILIKERCSGDLEVAPGTTFRPSACDAALLLAIVERVGAQPLARALQERVIGPARLAATGIEEVDPLAVVPNLARGYRSSGLLAEVTAPAQPFARSSLLSTTGDLFRLDQALYGPLISDTSKRQMFTSGLGSHGFGWDVRALPVGPGGAIRTVATAAGRSGAHQARIVRVIEDRHLVVLLSNLADGPLEAMTQGILDVLAGRPPRAPHPSLAEEVSRTLEKDGLDAALALLHAQAAGKSDSFDVSESELLGLGSDLLRRGQSVAGVAVLRLTAESFPASGPAWEALGDALAAAGERAEAVRSYAHALQIEPGNDRVMHHLAALATP